MVRLRPKFKVSQRIGPYVLLEFIGQGGLGEVWRAEKEGYVLVSTQCALKVFSNTYYMDKTAVIKSAELWKSASPHQNIVPILEAAEYGENLVIASEYHPEGNLEAWLRCQPGKAATLAIAVDMTVGVLEAIKHLHTRPEPLLHRDIKPANILLLGGAPRLIDFDLARVEVETWTGSSAGTPAYMAPEAIDSNSRTPQVDLWSAGVILYELIAGKKPFDDQQSIIHAEPVALPNSVPQGVQEVISRALQKDPSERYASAAEFQSALRQAYKVVEASIREMLEGVTVPRGQGGVQFEIVLTRAEQEMFTNNAHRDIELVRELMQEDLDRLGFNRTVWKLVLISFRFRARAFSGTYYSALKCAFLKKSPENIPNYPDWEEAAERSQTKLREWLSEKDRATLQNYLNRDLALITRDCSNSAINDQSPGEKTQSDEWSIFLERSRERINIFFNAYSDVLLATAFREMNDIWEGRFRSEQEMRAALNVDARPDTQYELTFTRKQLEMFHRRAKRDMEIIRGLVEGVDRNTWDYVIRHFEIRIKALVGNYDILLRSAVMRAAPQEMLCADWEEEEKAAQANIRRASEDDYPILQEYLSRDVEIVMTEFSRQPIIEEGSRKEGSKEFYSLSEIIQRRVQLLRDSYSNTLLAMGVRELKDTWSYELDFFPNRS